MLNIPAYEKGDDTKVKVNFTGALTGARANVFITPKKGGESNVKMTFHELKEAPGKPKYQYWTGEAPTGNLEGWLAKATEHPGSWWQDWLMWIRHLDGETVPARQPGGGKYQPIEDAPGSYVKVRD